MLAQLPLASKVLAAISRVVFGKAIVRLSTHLDGSGTVRVFILPMTTNVLSQFTHSKEWEYGGAVDTDLQLDDTLSDGYIEFHRHVRLDPP